MISTGNTQGSMQTLKTNKKFLRKRSGFFHYFKKNYELYLMSIPGLLFLIVYKFAPLYGLSLAFKDFNMFLGNGILDSIIKSPWVGLKHFEKILMDPEVFQIIMNTIMITLYKVVFLFPIPIILALLLNEIRFRLFKSSVNTLIFLPHFLSWVVVFGLFYTLLGNYGVVNQILNSVGFEPVKFFTDSSIFRSLLVSTDIWKEAGYYAIIIMAAITSVDPQLYEAAIVDGANRFQRMIYITLPGILPVVVLMLILRISDVLQNGFEQVLVMYNPAVYGVADIIQTYVYRIGLGRMDFSLGTALGLFESVIAFILIVLCNTLAKKTLGKGIW